LVNFNYNLIIMDILKRLNKTEINGHYEIVFQDDDFISLKELQQLNLAGYVYTGSQTGVDFEDEDEMGNLVTCYMDIYYFVQIDISSVNSIRKEFFPA
jgi:hypothetical protein